MLSDDYLVECKIDGEEGNVVRSSAPDPLPAEPPPKPDLRDPRGVNQHLKVEFNDVLAEPSSFHSFDRVWTWSDIVFEATRLWCYRGISVLCAIPVSLLAGFLFACLSCVHIWCVMPCIQLCTISLPPLRSLWASLLEVLVAPVCASVGRCCSRVYLRVSKE
ncbi:caveolin-2 [Lepisosteus oculatus]|uniref:caveolin-2 n=1 Tax=Lepisosteus oculatus TaxID=7918 RepID=UPI0035F5155F